MSRNTKLAAVLLAFSLILAGTVSRAGMFCGDAVAYDGISLETELKFKERIAQAVEDLKDIVNITDLKIPKSYNFDSIFYSFCEEHPEYFYLSTGYSASYKSNYFTYFSMNFTNEPEEIQEMKKVFNSAAKDALKGVDSSWPDYMKALYLHDYIVLNAEYDTNFDEWETDFNDMCYTAYGILVDKIGVCQGYTYAYSYLLNEVGIENKFVSSEDMCHTWNLVKIDGNYYHVDCTFDDTEYNNIGRAKHTNFLLSDEKIVTASATRHTDWEDSTDIKADSKKYDNYFWRSIESGFFPINNRWYFTDKKGNINSYDPESEAVDTLLSVDASWKRWGKATEFLNDKYVRLLVFSDMIIYNTDSAIYMTDTGNVQPEKIFEADVSSGYIYGIGLDKNNVTYCLKTRSGEAEKVYSTEISVDSLDSASTQKDIVKKVNYYGYGGVLLESQSLTAADEAIAPNMEDINGYRFINWVSSESNTEINFYAVYKLIGDMDGDGRLTLLDAYYILSLTKDKTNITTDALKIADINNDSTVNQDDCDLMLYNLTR